MESRLDHEYSAEALSAAIEALLLVAVEPLGIEELSRLTEAPVRQCQAVLNDLCGEYQSPRRGISIVQVAGGYRFATKPEHFEVVGEYARETYDARLSPAALETLAIVAYQQPISRRRVSVIRGVNSDAVMRLLAVKGYIEPAGRGTNPGSAVLYRTTTIFLERLGLNSLGELPELGKYAPSLEIAEAFEAALRDESS